MLDRQKILRLLEASGSDATPSPEDFGKQFRDIGLDSLDVFNLLSEIEVELGQKVDDEEFEHVQTLDDIIELINSR